MLVRTFHMLVAFGLCFFQGAMAAGDSKPPHLTVKPGKCVALKRGTVCYQTITLSWRALGPGDYCLYPGRGSTPLQCWTKRQSGSLRVEFASRESVQFELREAGRPAPIARAAVEVRWVYNRRRDRSFGWRLF